MDSVTTTDDDGAEKSVGDISPTVELREASSGAESNPSAAEPVFMITPSDVSTIMSGASGSFNITLKNLGTVKADRILVETTASEDVVLTDGSGSQDITSIAPNGTANVKISYKALSNISSAKQAFGVSLRYYYNGASGETIGTADSTVNVPAKVSSSAAEVTEQPLLKITGQTLSHPISAKTEYEYTLTVMNISDTDVTDIYLFFDASDSLYFIGGTESASIDYIDAKESEEVKVRFRTMDSITAVKQGITAHITYSYRDGGVDKTAESDSSVTIIANSTGDGSSSGGNIAVPNIIIKSYDIGAEQIAAGDSFELALNLFNTSTITGVENVIMTINAGGSVNIFGGTNTFYYPRIGAGGEISENIPLKALATAETGTSSISVSLKYDYIDNGSRSTVNFEQTIFVTVYQPDKMTFEVNVPTWAAQVGQDMYITTTYLNKGRSDISNVKAEIVGDVNALSTSKVIVTVQPGGNGSFDFIVNPYMPGTCEFVIMVTYEDATLTEVTKELPVSFEVEDFMDFGMYEPGFDDPGFEDPGLEEGKKFPWALLWIGIGVVVGCCAIVTMLSIGIGMQNSMERSLAEMGDLTLIEVYSGGQNSKLNDEAIRKFENIPGTEVVIGKGSLDNIDCELTAGEKDRYQMRWVNIVGFSKDSMEKFGLELIDGTFPKEPFEVLAGQYTAYNLMDTQRPEGSNMIDRWSYMYTYDPQLGYETYNENAELPEPYLNLCGQEMTMQMRSYEDYDKKYEQKIKITGVVKQDYNKDYSTSEGLIFME